jgi:hypothetical protein
MKLESETSNNFPPKNLPILVEEKISEKRKNKKSINAIE